MLFRAKARSFDCLPTLLQHVESVHTQVIADTNGNVKGTMANPAADPPLRPDGKLNVGEAVGRGVLAVVRSHPQNERPYQGMIPIATGEVAEDLARYLADSEQTNSALALGVSINRDASIRAAGGFLIQVGIGVRVWVGVRLRVWIGGAGLLLHYFALLNIYTTKL